MEMKRLVLLIWPLLALLASLPDAQAAAAKPHCRVFLASSASTRAALLSSAFDREGLAIRDAFSPSSLSLLPPAADFDASKVFQDVVLPFARAVTEFESDGGCHLHLWAMVQLGHHRQDLQDHQDDDKVDQETLVSRLKELAEIAVKWKDFPLTVKKEDVKVVDSEWRRFFQAVGGNFLVGNVPASLAPAQTEVLGVLEVGDEMAAVTFDQQERWRRNKRLRQAAAPLNTTDFFSREFEGFGRDGVAKGSLAALKDSTHPCYLKGDSVRIEDSEMEGSGSAVECLALLTTIVDNSNAECPPGSYCMLSGSAQPRSLGSFLAAGIARRVVLLAARALVDKAQALALSLPSPKLETLEDAAKELCKLPVDKLAVVAKKIPGTDETDAHLACLDMCHLIVLLKRLGVVREETRLMVVDHLGNQEDDSEQVDSEIARDRVEQRAWMTGAFLYAEAEQRKLSFSLEADQLAEQVREGLPIGWNLSVVVFVAAVAYLYKNTGAPRRRRHGYAAVASARRSGSFGDGLVVNGASGGNSKSKYSDTTQSIQFLDDASE